MEGQQHGDRLKRGLKNRHIQLIALPPEGARITGVVDRVHREIDKQDQVVADLVLVLRFGQRVEQAFPFGDARRHIDDLDFLQQSLDLRSRQTSVGIRKHATGGLHVLRTKGSDVSHVRGADE